MIKGLTIGKIQVLSVAQIKENAQRLDAKIEDLNTLKNVTYKKKVAEFIARRLFARTILGSIAIGWPKKAFRIG